MKLRHTPDAPLKFCPGCRSASVGWQDILRDFGRDASRSDGYKLYCRGCRRTRRKEGRGR